SRAADVPVREQSEAGLALERRAGLNVELRQRVGARHLDLRSERIRPLAFITEAELIRIVSLIAVHVERVLSDGPAEQLGAARQPRRNAELVTVVNLLTFVAGRVDAIDLHQRLRADVVD